MLCTEPLPVSFWIYSSDLNPLLYYSHIPSLFIALFLGLWLYFYNRKELPNKIFLSLTLIFSFLTIGNLIVWTNSNISAITLSWAFSIELFNWLIFFIAYFYYVYTSNQDVPKLYKIFFSVALLISPLILFSRFGIDYFDADLCELDRKSVV